MSRRPTLAADARPWLLADHLWERLVEAGLVTGFASSGRARLAGEHTTAEIASWLAAQGFRVRALAPIDRTLEDFYLEVTRSAASAVDDTVIGAE